MIPTKEQVTIGRLRKRIEKLKKQRDYYQTKYKYYAKVLSEQPYLERRYNRHEEMKADAEARKAMARRVKEQEIVIKLLMKDVPVGHWEIETLYSELIKREYKKINVSDGGMDPR